MTRPTPAPHGAGPGPGRNNQAPPLTPALVTRLQGSRGYPSVSLLMTTTPGPRMTPTEAARLERLRVQALARLRAERLLAAADPVVAGLDRLMLDAVQVPTDRGIALFAGPGDARLVVLPVEVEDRTVVDPTFATRDLVRALHRTPRHHVLVLGGRRAALFEGAGRRLTPAPLSGFPLEQPPDRRPGQNPQGWLRTIDRALGAYLREHPAPVVLAGTERTVTAFREISRHVARCAGAVHGNWEHADPADLVARAGAVLERYLRSRGQEALDLVERRTGAHRTASGIASAWLAARTEHPEMLAVEEGYHYPARLCADGDLVQPAADVEAPDVIDDLVDELIELVLARGGWIALVEDGSLGGHERVALTLRR